MTCKISFIKSVCETLKHHLSAIFAVSIVFFIQLIIFFLNIQNISSVQILSSGPILNYERIKEMTLPGAAYVIPVIFAAILLGFDFFKYLHSKKQIDFYDSLPMKRKDWYLLRTASAFLVFLIPYSLCTVSEILLLVVYEFTETIFFTNLMWNFICMVLIFLITFLAAVLAMIMTGHSVIAIFAFCIFSGYAPILLHYLYPSYAYEYFKTYVSDDYILQYLDYLSPIGLAYRLLDSNYLEWTANTHLQDIIILIVMILLTAILSFYLYLKRPSESAGRAMAFEKLNPIIRILLVIPITLYIGLYLSQVASVASKGWMIFGFLIGTVLLHGIIESIFQFDIRGLGTHKRQMVICFAACIGVAFIFWNDVFRFDKYVPELDEVKSISIQTGEYYSYNETADGIGADNLDDAIQLAENLIEQDLDVTHGKEWILFTYRLKNGCVKQREYYMDIEANEELINRIYATKEYKNDICPLYTEDWEKVSYIRWSDSISEEMLLITQEEMDRLFETYIAEYTPLTYSEVKSKVPVGSFVVCFDETYEYRNFQCYVFPQFTQTIAMLEKYMADNESTQNYGPLTESPVDKYPITSIEIYFDDSPLLINNQETIESLKEHLIMSDYFYKMNNDYNWELYYEATINFMVEDGYGYTSFMIPREIADTLKN